MDIASKQEYALAMNTKLESPVQIETTLPENGLEYTDEHRYNRLELKNGTNPQCLKFYNNKMECVGSLHFGPAVTFEGDAEEAAKVFLRHYGK